MKFRSIKSFAIILILCVDFGQNFAQTDLNNHKKYGYYKTRLNNDFIKIGLDPGNSIPANERAYIQGSPYDFNSKNTQWGDASARLGIYLSALAKEFRLLKNKGRFNRNKRI